MTVFRAIQRILTRHPLAVFALLLALASAYLLLVREAILKERPDLAWWITFGIMALGLVVEQIARVYFENFHTKLSGALLRSWRWTFDENFHFSFFAMTTYRRADIKNQELIQLLADLGDGFRLSLQGNNFVQLRERGVPITFQVQWTTTPEAEHEFRESPDVGTPNATEVTVSLVQDLVLGYRTGQKTIDMLINRYQRIQGRLDQIFEATADKNIFAEGAWFDGDIKEAASRTFDDKTFGAKIDIVGMTVHVRAASADAVRALRTQLGGLQAA